MWRPAPRWRRSLRPAERARVRRRAERSRAESLIWSQRPIMAAPGRAAMGWKSQRGLLPWSDRRVGGWPDVPGTAPIRPAGTLPPQPGQGTWWACRRQQATSRRTEEPAVLTRAGLNASLARSCPISRLRERGWVRAAETGRRSFGSGLAHHHQMPLAVQAGHLQLVYLAHRPAFGQCGDFFVRIDAFIANKLPPGRSRWPPTAMMPASLSSARAVRWS